MPFFFPTMRQLLVPPFAESTHPPWLEMILPHSWQILPTFLCKEYRVHPQTLLTSWLTTRSAVRSLSSTNNFDGLPRNDSLPEPVVRDQRLGRSDIKHHDNSIIGASVVSWT
jgi:hypothetical protein